MEGLLQLLVCHPEPAALTTSMLALIPSSLDEYLPYHLQLVLGLQEYASTHSDILGLPSLSIVDNFSELQNCFLLACADFPKVCMNARCFYISLNSCIDSCRVALCNWKYMSC